MMRKKNFHKSQQEFNRAIYGFGNCPADMKNKNCEIRVVPSSITGFAKLLMVEVNDRSRRSKRDNLDLEKFASNRDDESHGDMFDRDETAEMIPEAVGNIR